MRCSTCKLPIQWVPKPNGRRVPVGVDPVPNGPFFLDARGCLRAHLPGITPEDVPRYVLHYHPEAK